MSAKLKKFLNSNLDFAELLAEKLEPYGEQVPSKPGKASNKSKRMAKLIGKNRGLALAKTDPGLHALLDHQDADVRTLARARLAVSSWPNHQKRITNLVQLAKCCNGKMPIPTKYAGAHTKRASGAEGVNFYNLPARGHDLITQTKSLVKTPADSLLLIFDFAQIEARYVAWLAGQTSLIKAYSEGRDVYSEFASEFFRSKVRKPTKNDPPPIANRMQKRRQFGKKVILGAGYGMGANRFYESCREEQLDATPELAQQLIQAYRSMYPMIVKLWYGLEGWFKYVLRFPDEPGEYNGIRLRHEADNNRVVATLRSGVKLFYPGVEWCKTTDNLKWKWSTGGSFWGGAMTENIVQADCGFILRQKAVQIEKDLGLRVLLDVYDSLYILTPKKKAKENYKRVEKILCQPLDWCTDMPLAVEGEITQCLK